MHSDQVHTASFYNLDFGVGMKNGDNSNIQEAKKRVYGQSLIALVLSGMPARHGICSALRLS